MRYVQAVPRDGLGFPLLPVIIGAGSLVGLFKKKKKLSSEDARKLVRQIYLELLERDLDPGAEGYVDCLVKGWCDVDFVRTEILSGPEYRDVQLQKARAVYGPSSSSAPEGAAPPEEPGQLFGIPIVYLVGGLVLVMLLRR